MANTIFGAAPPQDPNSLGGYTGPVDMIDNPGDGRLGSGGPFRDRDDDSQRTSRYLSKPLSQNSIRYTKIDKAWHIQAAPGITPILLPEGVELLGLKPLLTAEGIIVKVDEWYLISPKTLAYAQSPKNPHYDYVVNGTIPVKDKQVAVGETIPIITISLEVVNQTIAKKALNNRNAGVKTLEYIMDGEKIDDVPKRLVDQINYTLTQANSRPSDVYSVFDLKLQGDYSIEVLKVENKQGDKILDKSKLEAFISGSNDRLTKLRADFNMIKNMFYFGQTPDTLSVSKYNLMATADGIQDEDDMGITHTVTIKDTQLLSVDKTPLEKQADVTTTKQTELQTQVESKTTKLQSDIQSANEQLQRAQSGDQQAIEALQRQIVSGGGQTQEAIKQIQALQKALAAQK
jgi:hypothetical protein